MKNQRVKNAKFNIVTSLTGQMVSIACGLILPRLMIGAFGSEAYGATTSITQFLAYITLLEGGIGGVARATLYKPLARNDIDTIRSIMREVTIFFRRIAYFFAGYVLIIACCFKTISQLACMDWISTFFLVIVISISTFGQYFIGISNSIFLQADQKTYITNVVSIAATVLNTVCTVAMIELEYNLIVVKLVSGLIFFMRPVALSFYVNKRYHLGIQSSNSERIYLKQKWTGLGQHIAFFLHSNTDTVVLTVLASLRMVAVYSIYNMIVSHIQSFVVSFSSGMEAVFGDILARDQKKQLHNTFQTYETILSVVSTIIFSTATALIMPFIKIYTSGITDANYIQPIGAFLMILTALSYCLRLPYHSMVIAAGHFKQTRVAAYGEAVINIVLSIILVFEYGLAGVATATLLATCFRFVYYVLYLSKNIFGREIRLFLKRFAINAGTFVCNGIIGYGIISCISISNYLVWMICGVLLVTIISILTLGINIIFFKKDCCSLMKKIIKR